MNQFKGGAGFLFEQIMAGILKYMGTGLGESVSKFVKEMNVKTKSRVPIKT